MLPGAPLQDSALVSVSSRGGAAKPQGTKAALDSTDTEGAGRQGEKEGAKPECLNKTSKKYTKKIPKLSRKGCPPDLSTPPASVLAGLVTWPVVPAGRPEHRGTQ